MGLRAQLLLTSYVLDKVVGGTASTSVPLQELSLSADKKDLGHGLCRTRKTSDVALIVTVVRLVKSISSHRDAAMALLSSEMYKSV